MKATSFIAFMVATVAVGAFAQAVPPSPAQRIGPTVEAAQGQKRMSPALKRRAEMFARSGGLIEAPVTGKVVRVANAQSLASRAMIDKAVRSFTGFMKFPVDVKDGTLDQAIDEKAGVVILLADDPKWPTVLVAPEDGWSAVNVRRLVADKPTDDVLSQRLVKEFWRAAAMVLGASNSMMKPCVLMPIRNLADLDACTATLPAPEPLPKMDIGARSFGILPRRRVSYKRACIEGWAPAPTNEVQKGIWEDVKRDKERGPTNPITIPPPAGK